MRRGGGEKVPWQMKTLSSRRANPVNGPTFRCLSTATSCLAAKRLYFFVAVNVPLTIPRDVQRALHGVLLDRSVVGDRRLLALDVDGEGEREWRCPSRFRSNRQSPSWPSYLPVSFSPSCLNVMVGRAAALIGGDGERPFAGDVGGLERQGCAEVRSATVRMTAVRMTVFIEYPSGLEILTHLGSEPLAAYGLPNASNTFPGLPRHWP